MAFATAWPLTEKLIKFCGLSDDEYEDLYENVFEDIDEFENNTFWDHFAEKIAIVKREEEAKRKGVKFSKKKAFIKFCEYENEINKRLEDVNLVDLWTYVAQYFKK